MVLMTSLGTSRPDGAKTNNVEISTNNFVVNAHLCYRRFCCWMTFSRLNCCDHDALYSNRCPVIRRHSHRSRGDCNPPTTTTSTSRSILTASAILILILISTHRPGEYIASAYFPACVCRLSVCNSLRTPTLCYTNEESAVLLIVATFPDAAKSASDLDTVSSPLTLA
ncbi:uncharacterized [Tachysurus ichikawai]